MTNADLNAAHLALQKAFDAVTEKMKTATPAERKELIAQSNRLTDVLMELIQERRAWYRDQLSSEA